MDLNKDKLTIMTTRIELCKCVHGYDGARGCDTCDEYTWGITVYWRRGLTTLEPNCRCGARWAGYTIECSLEYNTKLAKEWIQKPENRSKICFDCGAKFDETL